LSMSQQSRALIIVNTHFYSRDGDEVPPGVRQGAKREAEKLSRSLSRLNYKVLLMHNKTAEEIKALYQQERSCPQGQFFLSIISSHGGDGFILGCDSEPLQLRWIFQVLAPERCPALTTTPKIFFIQACRGHQLDPGVVLECDGDQPEWEPDGFSDYLSIPPQTAAMFSCSPGYVAFQNPLSSMFLQALLKVLQGEERHLPLNRLLTRINWEVAFTCQARGFYEGCKQMPCFVTNLLHEVFPFSA
ncbi:CASP3 protein, partial [Brachypteracias leptosomus]|nr:CASP3 protein [Brachypteracias leptosomus]